MAACRKYRIKWFRLLIMVIIGYGVYICGDQYVQSMAVSREVEGARKKLEQLQQVSQSMVEERQRLKTADHVEKLAREELGLVKPGEVPYMR